MSYQAPPQQPQAGLQADPAAARQQAQQQLIEQILGGELPGSGYLYADDPAKRQEQLVKTTADFVRDNLLRAIEVLTFDLQLPFSEDKKADVGKAILECAQAYLLLDPTVDETGNPVEGEGSKAQAMAKAQHQFPPRVQPNAAEEGIKQENEGKSDALRGTRGQTPRPQPRVGS